MKFLSSLCLGLMLCWPAAGAEKLIKLRNETIATPAKPQIQAFSAADSEPQKGLWLVQFEGAFQPAWEQELRALGVELIRPVPEDAFVAELNGASISALKKLNFVRWVGPFKAAYKLDRSAHPKDPAAPSTVRILLKPQAKGLERLMVTKGLARARTVSEGRFGTVLEASVTLKQLQDLAFSPAVLWIEAAPEMKLFDAVATQIIAGEVDDEARRGLTSVIHDLGFTGEGVTVAVADSGLMEGTVENMHPDLDGRVVAFFQYGQLTDASDEHSHGTHVTGIIAGNGATGETDEGGYLYGLGVAPQSSIIAQRMFDGLGGYHAPESMGRLTRDAIRAGADIGSNSWGDDTQGRYDITAMEFDALVRDADSETPGDQPYILEFSAGNAGPGVRTIGSPAVAKNVIASGASQNNRPEFILWAEGQEAMADFSSRGPAEDGRIKPDVVAPGTWIASLQSSFATDENAWLPISPNYMYQGGTSQSGPHVSGAAALFVQYYRQRHNGQTPSPALVKAALINTASDLADSEGTLAIPNNDEGWGRVDLIALLGGELNLEFVEQTNLLTAGQTYERRIFIADPDLPLKITMAYTDVPGFPAAIPALVNDLDLEVVAPNGVIYRGNQFLNGESVPSAIGRDSLNNVEGVHLMLPEAGEYLVRVRGRNIPSDARSDTAAIDQDFALVVSGGVPFPGQAYVVLDRQAYRVPSTASIRLIDFDLPPGQPVTVRAASTSEPAGFSLLLQPGAVAGVFSGAVPLAAGGPISDQVLQVSHGDTITVSYADASSGATVTGASVIDTVPPVVSSVAPRHEFGLTRIEWVNDEPARAVVEFGATTALGQSASNTAYLSLQSVELPPLANGQTYFYRVVAEDRAGNVRVADNNGALFSFVAQGAPPILLVDDYRRGPNDEGEEIPVTSYTDALDQVGLDYDIWSIPLRGSPPLQTLRNYKIVMWRINDSFWDGSVIAPDQENSIFQYVAGGGSFFMASMEIISRMHGSPIIKDIFHVEEFVRNEDLFGDCPDCNEDHGASAIIGSLHDTTSSGVDVALDYSLYPSFEFDPIFIGPDVSDTFVPSTNAVTIFTEPDGGTVGIRAPRLPQGSQGRVVFLSFPLDGIPMTGSEPNTRAGVLRKIFGFLAPGLDGSANIALDNERYTAPSPVNIELGDSDLAGAGQATVQISSDTTPNGVAVVLTETVRPGIFQGFAVLVPEGQAAAAGQLHVQEGDTVVVRYQDASAGRTASVSATVDLTDPQLSEPEAESDYETLWISWTSDEPADSLVQFGESPLLGRTAYRGHLSTDHSIQINNLVPSRTYYYRIVSRDQAGNTTINDNSGALFTIDTLTPLATPVAENFEQGQNTWDIFTDDEIGYQTWELGKPENLLASSGHSGTNAWATNLRGEYFDASHAFLISPAIQLPSTGASAVRFWHNYDFTAPATFEFAQLLLFTNTQTQPIILRDYSFTASGDWEEEVVDLSAHAGRVVQIVWEYLLFDLEEAREVHHGWLVDDFAVTGTTAETGTIAVQSNLSQARFRIVGPTGYTGAGSSFTITNAPAGDYEITFEPVGFYTAPISQTATLAPGGALTFTANYTFPDDNNNQISDMWEAAFPRTGGDPMRRDDPDGDGASDYEEFLAGTDPTDANSSFRLLTPMPTGPNRAQLRWFSSAGRDYTIFDSANGRDWTQQGGALRASGAEASATMSGLTNRSTLFRVRVVP